MSGPGWKPFLNPIGLLILVVTAVLASVIKAAAPWSDRAGWIVLWGVIAYAATMLISAIPQRAVRFESTRALAVSEPTLADAAERDLIPVTEEALRRLNDLAALATCSLIARIPLTLSARRDDDSPAAGSPLEVARTLRTVMVDAIERLRPASTPGGAPGEAAVLRYAILHEEYVLGRPNHQIMARHNVSESTFHRYRRVGTRALAAELARSEQLLSQDVTRA